MSVKPYILINDYKALLDFIYEGKIWDADQLSQREPHSSYRQIVRALILEKRKPYLVELCKAEGKVLKKEAPDHTTIIHSRNNFRDVLTHRYSGLIARLNQFYEELINEQLNIQSAGAAPFKMDYIDGATHIHLHFCKEPTPFFLNRLKDLIEIENKSSTHG